MQPWQPVPLLGLLLMLPCRPGWPELAPARGAQPPAAGQWQQLAQGVLAQAQLLQLQHLLLLLLPQQQLHLPVPPP